MDARLLFLYGKPGALSAKLRGQCDYLDIENSREVSKFVRLGRYLKEMKPAVVHFHDDLLWPQILNLGRRPWKTVIHAHLGGVPRPRHWKVGLLYWAQRRHADKIVCITEEVRSSKIRNVGFKPDIMKIIYNGVDQKRFRAITTEDRAEVRKGFGLPSDAPVVGFVGRIYDEHKGIFDFLEMFSHLPNSFYGLVAGSGPDETAARKLGDDFGIGPRIQFVGLLAEPERAYQAIDVFAFASRYEGFGLTIAEAMACEVPVVGFDCPGGWCELLTNETGHIIFQRDLHEMAHAVELAAKREGNWLEKIAAAKAVLRSRHDWDVATRELVCIYRELIDPHRE